MSIKDEKEFNLNRREFGKFVGSAGLGFWLAPSLPQSTLAAEGPNPATIIPGKITGRIIHIAKLGVMETRSTELRKYYITPKEIAYSRMRFPVSGANKWGDSLKPAPFKEWNIEVSGLVERLRILSLKELQKMQQTKPATVMQLLVQRTVRQPTAFAS